VVGIEGAGHAEYEDSPAEPLITLASCAVDGRSLGAPRLSGKLKITVDVDSRAFRAYQRREIEEEFNCSYELNPAYRERLEAGGLCVSGVGDGGEARIVELAGGGFYLATAFLPQLSSQPGRPHPVVAAYLSEAVGSPRRGHAPPPSGG
jgi:CTP synthase (UTP-ammonia lyase)